MGDDMSEYVDVRQSDNRNDLTVSLNANNEIVIEHDCNDYTPPYVIIGIDSWQDIKAAIDALIEATE